MTKPEWVTFAHEDFQFWTSHEAARGHVEFFGGRIEAIPSDMPDDDEEDE